MVSPTSNFAFLSAHDGHLVKLGALAERYFRDDPVTSIFKLRQFAELLSKTIAAHHALLDEGETLEETLRRLSYERIIPGRPRTSSMPCERQATRLFTKRPAIIRMRCRR